VSRSTVDRVIQSILGSLKSDDVVGVTALVGRRLIRQFSSLEWHTISQASLCPKKPQPDVSRAIRHLIAGGYIEKRPDGSDKRKNQYRIGPKWQTAPRAPLSSRDVDSLRWIQKVRRNGKPSGPIIHRVRRKG